MTTSSEHHGAEPEFLTWTRVSDGGLADLTIRKEFPVIAICVYCRQCIYSELSVSKWTHAIPPDVPEDVCERAKERVSPVGDIQQGPEAPEERRD